MFLFPMKTFLLSFFAVIFFFFLFSFAKIRPSKKERKKNLGTIMGTFFALFPAVPCHKSVFDVIYFSGRPSFIFFFVEGSRLVNCGMPIVLFFLGCVFDLIFFFKFTLSKWECNCYLGWLCACAMSIIAGIWLFDFKKFRLLFLLFSLREFQNMFRLKKLVFAGNQREK